MLLTHKSYFRATHKTLALVSHLGYAANVTSSATTVDEYLAQLPPDRRAAIEQVRAVIRQNLPDRVEEGIQYGMIGYYIPHRIYPAGYHCDPTQPLPFAALGSQKNHLALYAMFLYAPNPLLDWFKQAWAASGKKLDMGKACIRFKKVENIPLDVVGQLFARVSVDSFIARHNQVRKKR